jgi:hypothetical protein
VSELRDELAIVVHNALCSFPSTENCAQWQRPGSPHKDFYELRAQNLIAELELVIGWANVLPVVRTVLDEVEL